MLCIVRLQKLGQ